MCEGLVQKDIMSLNTSGMDEQGNTRNRGFAAMDEERQREIASMGGKVAHQKGTAHEFTSEEAKKAGRKGGRARHNNAESEDEETDTD